MLMKYNLTTVLYVCWIPQVHLFFERHRGRHCKCVALQPLIFNHLRQITPSHNCEMGDPVTRQWNQFRDATGLHWTNPDDSESLASALVLPYLRNERIWLNSENRSLLEDIVVTTIGLRRDEGLPLIDKFCVVGGGTITGPFPEVKATGQAKIGREATMNRVYVAQRLADIIGMVQPRRNRYARRFLQRKLISIRCNSTR
jgi:hypothetical protein